MKTFFILLFFHILCQAIPDVPLLKRDSSGVDGTAPPTVDGIAPPTADGTAQPTVDSTVVDTINVSASSNTDRKIAHSIEHQEALVHAHTKNEIAGYFVVPHDKKNFRVHHPHIFKGAVPAEERTAAVLKAIRAGRQDNPGEFS
ncbi:MAG: hypothetical protein M1821_001857 [Bathelium mastoideum]|nr:MAG: hypothetical protein M1821_001857 [Bathelium mastoideum]